MKIKHFAGYGFVDAKKIKHANPHVLHIRVEGNHEWGLLREDMYDLYNWLVKRFDKKAGDVYEWCRNATMEYRTGTAYDALFQTVETCDYYFYYERGK